MGKMLTESTLKEVERLVESSNLNSLDVSAVKELLEESGKDVSQKHLAPTVAIMQLEEKFINESNFTSNIEPYTAKLQPLLRRIVPSLLAFEIAGVQPVSSPDSAVFMIKSRYAGNKTDGIISNTAKILVHDNVSAPTVGATITSSTGASATVKYVETGKIIVDSITGTFVTGDKFDIGGSYSAGADDNTITAVYSNETAYKQILKDYSGPYTTAAGEVLGAAMNQIKTTIEKMTVGVKTRALKAEFSAELVQDMRVMHGADAESELMVFLETEIGLDLDREIIETYKSIATTSADFAVATTTHSQGRWNMEMYAGLWQRILYIANRLSIRNRRGKGNKLVTTAGVIAALESLGKFKTTAYPTGVQTGENQATAYVGTLSNGMDVYQDWFATSEYCMVIYKGNDTQMDAGLIYSPYVPLEFANAIDPSTLQPVMGVKTRYGLTANTLMDDEGGSSYADMFVVDFTSTPMLDS